MENIDNLRQIYEQLRSCTNPGELEMLKNSLKGSIHVKKGRKESDPDSCIISGSKEPGYRNVGKSRLLSVADKSREVDNLIKEVKELAEMGKFGDDLTIEVHEEKQHKFLTSNLVGEKFESHMNEISDLLTKNKALTIGVWGMGGVGKTTLIKHLHNHMLEHPHIYGSVYWITVSKDCSMQKLQTDIAKQIGKSISESLDDLERAAILAEALKMKKKFVVILDDMWSDFDLNEVGLGIPKEIKYRLIVTSRSKDVCSKMYCDNIIKVVSLSENDAWTLFVRSIGREISDDLTKICTDVLRECGGLPLGIITLAKSMIGCNDVCEWRNVLEKLRNSSGKVDDMEEKVFNVLRLSYERLKDEEMKECLVYCATYPEDCRINMKELIWLFIDAGLLGVNVGMAKMFDKGRAILKKLERVALLSIERSIPPISLYYQEIDWVCIHDLIRDITLQIAGSRFMIKANKGLDCITDKESWTDQLEVVSLEDNQIKEISNSSPKCKRLTTLLLKGNYSLSMVCDDFFKHFDGLKLLDISRSKIRTLPKSISLLKNLNVLILRECGRLENVTLLTKLSSLEKLDLYHSSISKLPKDIERLVKLRYFNLFKTRIEKIGKGVINKLIALEYLAIDAEFEVEELWSLKNLEHLSIEFKDFVSFFEFIKKMKSMGRPKSYGYSFKGTKCFSGVHMSNQFDENEVLSTHVAFLLKYEDMVFTDNCLINLVRNLWEDKSSDVNKYNRLVKILFGNLSKIRSVEIEGVKVVYENEYQEVLQDIHLLFISHVEDLMSLEDLLVTDLQKQCKLGGGPQPFYHLKCLSLSECPNLKKLFSLQLLSNLQNIEELKVSSCNGLEELIDGGSNASKVGGNFSLPKLRAISLYHLLKLKRLCSDDKVIQTPSLQIINIGGCRKLNRMPFDVDNQPQPFLQMTYYKEEEEWVKARVWDPPQSKRRFILSARATSKTSEEWFNHSMKKFVLEMELNQISWRKCFAS